LNALLQRLAGQALGSKATGGTTRIRAAASVHALPPAASPATETVRRSNLTLPAKAESRDFSRVDVLQEKLEPTNPGLVTRPPAAPLEWRSSLRESEPPATLPQPNPLAPLLPQPESKSPEAVTRLPERLLAEAMQPASHTTSMMPVQPPPLAVSRATAAEQKPTEVHVHIGRIEVTAAQETAAPAKQRRTPRAPRPLSDYLARGSRR